MNIFKKKSDKQAQLELAAKQNKLLLNCKNDIAFLQEMIKLVNKSPDMRVEMIMLDGTRLNIYSTAMSSKKNISEAQWNYEG